MVNESLDLVRYPLIGNSPISAWIALQIASTSTASPPLLLTTNATEVGPERGSDSANFGGVLAKTPGKVAEFGD